VGTMAYMAPERFTAGVADARSDVYALACVLHECLTGLQPYPGTSMEQQVAGHLAANPPRPTATRPELPAGLDEVIARGMAKNPDERYQSADELATAARDALRTEPSSTPAPAPVDPSEPAPTLVGYIAPTRAVGPPKRSALRVVVPLLLAVLLVGASAFAVTQLLRPEPGSSPQWVPYVAAARQGVVVMTSVDFRRAKEDIQRTLDISTGKLRDNLQQRAADFAKMAEDSKMVRAGTVTAAGLVSFSPPTAKVLVAATSKVTNDAGAQVDSKQLRYLMTVVNEGGQYKISDMEIVQ
jgi:serine/threonine protein kinase, bacterial